MKKEDFSLYIDEMTDLGTIKTLAMVVRLFNDGGIEEPDLFAARDMFYAAVEVKGGDHRSLYESIVGQFNRDGINYKNNLKGFGADTCNVMMGQENSVSRLLKKDCPGMVIMKCSCHSLALCASHSCKVIPDYLEQLLRDMHSFISNSPKRASEFKLLQEIVELKPLKLLHPAATRWLSLEQVVKRCIERFAELELFFSFQANTNKNQTAARILTHLKDPMTKPLLMFLNFILPVLNRLNRLFQSEQPQITSLHAEIKEFMMFILMNVCKKEYVANLSDPNADNFEAHLKQDVYVGIEAEAAASGLDEERRRTFLGICQRFYVQLFKQLRKRFDLTDPILLATSNLNPSGLLDLDSICPTVAALPGFFDGDLQLLEDEFRSLQMKLMRKEISSEGQSAQEWWGRVVSLKKGNCYLAFPLLRKFIGRIFLIPHSSACVERIFSQYNNNKTKLRNKLSMETMDAVLKSKNYVKEQGGSAKLKLTDNIKKRFNSNMYKHHNKTDNDE